MRVLLILSLGFIAMVDSSWAQMPRGRDDAGQSRGGFRVPAEGTLLPDVSLFDEHGQPFSTADLRGHYSVLVFGCLT